jgi:hypothetical protein
MSEKFTIVDADGDEIEINHNYSFGKFHLTVYVTNPDSECCGIRLSLDQALELSDEINRLIDEERSKK